MIKFRKIVATATVGLLAVVALPSIVGATGNTINVAEVDVTRQAEGTAPDDVWVIYKSPGTATATFIEGPEGNHTNHGSLELSTPNSDDRIGIFNYQHIGTKLDEINALSYHTYRFQGDGQDIARLAVEVDTNGPDVPGGNTTLVFDPANNPTQGIVVDDRWWTWNGIRSGQAIWSSSNPIPGALNGELVSWSTIISNNPDAVIYGGVGITQGDGTPGLITAVDDFTVGYLSDARTYDFELVSTRPAHATSKEQCKKYGWRDNFPAGFYKNQGHCVSSVVPEVNRDRGEDVNDFFESMP